MSTLTPDATRTSFVTLAGEVASGARELAVAHGEQLKTEIKTHAIAATTAVAGLILGAVLAVLGLIFALVSVVFVLIQYASLTPAAAWGIVAGAIFVIGAIIAAVMWTKLKHANLVPRQTLNSIQESLQWITRR